MSVQVTDTKKASVITKMDLFHIWWRWLLFFNPVSSYLRYYGVGFCWSMVPVLKKLYKDRPEEMKAALARETSFYITEAGFGMVINGIVLAMEESRARGEDISDDVFITLKSALMGPVAGFGDSIMDSILRTLLIAISQPLAAQGLAIAVLVGPGLKILARLIIGAVMLPLGYKAGSDAVETLLDNGLFQKILSGAAVVSMFIMGSMSCSFVSLKTPLVIGDVKIQGIIDTALPGILPLATVLICYHLISKKNVSIIKVILGIMAICLLGSFIGIL